MSVTTFPSTPSFPLAPQPMRWTVDEFHRVYNDPVFERRRFMLVDGEVFEMPIPNPPHAAAILLVEAALRMAFGIAYSVRGQLPLVLNLATDPMPDVAVVAGTARDFVKKHPDSAVLVVEVSDSTLSYDTGSKASLYAAARIADYWVVDLMHRQLIVHRSPVADVSQPHGAKYASITTLDPTASAAPLAAAGIAIQVAELLP